MVLRFKKAFTTPFFERTHEGEWTGIKPTHKRLSFTGVDIDKVIDGKIVEHGGAVNTFETLYEQHMIKPV